MKITKRIFIGLLSLALLVACLAFGVAAAGATDEGAEPAPAEQYIALADVAADVTKPFAERYAAYQAASYLTVDDTDPAIVAAKAKITAVESELTTVAGFRTTLEYFTAPVFINEDFNTLTLDAIKTKYFGSTDSLLVDDGMFSAASAAVADGKLSFTLANKAALSMNLAGSEGVGINLRLQGSAAANKTQGPTLAIFLYSEESAIATQVLYLPLANSSESDIKINSVAVGKAAGYDNTTKAGVWYSVSIFCAHKADGNTDCTVTVTPDGGAAITSTFTLEDFTLASANLAFAKNPRNQNAIVQFDYMEAYSGSQARVLSQRDTVVDQTLVDILGYYNENVATFNDVQKLCLLEMMNEVVSPRIYKYSPVSDAAKAAVTQKRALLAPLYATRLLAEIDSLDITLPYDERCEAADALLILCDELPEDLTQLTGGEWDLTALGNARAAVDAELALLAGYKTQSDGFIAALVGLDLTGNYAALKPYYDAASAYTPFDTYPGVAEAKATFTLLERLYVPLEKLCREFVANAAIAANLEKTFAERYPAYAAAVEAPADDTSYTGVAEAIAQIAGLKDEMDRVATASLKFIAAVGKANASTYFPAKKTYLADAETVAADPTLKDDIRVGYPGVETAQQTLAAVRLTIETQETASRAFIAAVALIRDDMSFNEKLQAVQNALELQAVGEVEGVDGISEASLKLSSAEADVMTRKGYSDSLISLVAKAKAATDATVRRQALTSALTLKDKVEPTYAGVADAIVELDSMVAEYNTSVETANNGFSEINGVVIGVSIASASVALGAAIILILRKLLTHLQ